MESKTYVFGNEGAGCSNIISSLASMLNRGTDPATLMTMANNGGFGGNNGWWIIILLWAIWGRNGFGNNGENQQGTERILATLNGDTGREMINNAIQGNATAISQLASTLNCDINTLQTAMQGISQQICNVGNQVGLSSQQTISAVQQGNMAITNQLGTCCCDIKTQLASCCCDIKDSITKGNYENQIATLNQTNQLQASLNSINVGQERGFSQVGYATADQTCQIKNAITEGIGKILAGQKEAELRELNRDLVERDREISRQAVVINNGQQSALFGQMINQAVTPINSAIAGLAKEVGDIQCKLPQTVTLPYSCATAVPTCAAWQYGLNGFGLNGGLWG